MYALFSTYITYDFLPTQSITDDLHCMYIQSPDDTHSLSNCKQVYGEQVICMHMYMYIVYMQVKAQ